MAQVLRGNAIQHRSVQSNTVYMISMIVQFIATFPCHLDSCDNVDIRRFSVPGKPHAVISEKISIL